MRYDPIMCMMVDDSVKTEDSNTLYETFAHGKSKHAGVLEMNGKAKVVVWNEGENPRTGKVTVIGEDTPSNRSKAKSMLDSASALDHAIRSCDEDKDRYEVVKIGEFLYGIYDNIKKKVVIESTKTGIESYSKMFNAKNLNNPRKI